DPEPDQFLALLGIDLTLFLGEVGVVGQEGPDLGRGEFLEEEVAGHLVTGRPDADIVRVDKADVLLDRVIDSRVNVDETDLPAPLFGVPVLLDLSLAGTR